MSKLLSALMPMHSAIANMTTTANPNQKSNPSSPIKPPWRDHRNHPSDDRTVLVFDGSEVNPVWPGYYSRKYRCWFWADGSTAPGAKQWREIPHPNDPQP